MKKNCQKKKKNKSILVVEVSSRDWNIQISYQYYLCKDFLLPVQNDLILLSSKGGGEGNSQNNKNCTGLNFSLKSTAMYNIFLYWLDSLKFVP